MSGKERKLVDSGTAPEIFVSGLARVDVMGTVSRLVFYIERSVVDAGDVALLDECPVSVILPNSAIQGLINLLSPTFELRRLAGENP